jgi:L-seryl-tRNA(Ser) seleniumtransferase
MRLVAEHGRPAVVSAIRDALHRARMALLHNMPATLDATGLMEAVAGSLGTVPRLTRVINASGIVLHTNLGRAPLAQEAVLALVEAAGACTLEYELRTGVRGSRTQGVEPLLCALTGAQASLAVNNNAAAMLLALTALAAGGEVIVSRGELIEIGGGFRIPDVIRQGGARLVEVGATNKTRLADYRNAITPATRILLKVHPSNFRMLGFTAAVSRGELAGLARANNLITVEDLGSGALTDLRTLGREPEDTVQDAIGAGMDVVAFSGDKLLGGPQCGLLVGSDATIDRMRRHPLLRALRLDKLTLAALEATLRLHQAGAIDRIPTLRMLAQPVAVLRSRAERLVELIKPYGRIESSEAAAGGGTLPAQPIPSFSVALAAPAVSADMLAARLRAETPPVIARIAQDMVRLDLLTVAEPDLPELAAAVLRAVGA